MALYAFDGTWNDSSASSEKRDIKKDTNVHRFRMYYRDEVSYVNGVGTRHGFLGQIVGGAFGVGAEKRVQEQFNALQGHFRSGDTVIDVVGYSRGAAIARMFVHRIQQAFDTIQLNDQALNEPPKVRFLGLFDTVASFGIPWNADEGNFQQEIPSFVENTFHAMAFDETRETFGIERCVGDREKITEVWFRGGHGDIGGNATYTDRRDEVVGNRERSDITLKWMLAKAKACNLPVEELRGEELPQEVTATQEIEPPVTALDPNFRMGRVGTLSRRVHAGDFVHYSMDENQLTKGIQGLVLRRVNVPTRIEDRELERQTHSPHNWIAVGTSSTDNIKVSDENPMLEDLSTKRYPFDVPPARTWSAWLNLWNVDNPGIDSERLAEFWAPSQADRALAWDVYVELMTRIAVQELKDSEGSDKSALDSVYELFGLARTGMREHGVECANSGTLLTAYLNKKVRWFTAKWHKVSIDDDWKGNPRPNDDFRRELRDQVQPALSQLAKSLSVVAGASLE